MRRDKVGRRTATLMYARWDRRSATRRMMPLTGCASARAGRNNRNRCHRDLPCGSGSPAHGGGLAYLPVREMASGLKGFVSGGHLAPEEARELPRDRRGDDPLRTLPAASRRNFPKRWSWARQARKTVSGEQRSWHFALIGPTNGRIDRAPKLVYP
jgi:hypothetical protein